MAIKPKRPASRPRPAPHALRLRRRLGVPARRAWRAFTSPAELSRWFTTKARADLRVGGRYSNADGDRGMFLAVRPPRRVRFSWDNPKHCPGTVVEARFLRIAPDRSEIRLRHTGLASRRDREEMKGGWSWALDSLRSYLETGRPVTHEEWLRARRRRR